VSHLVADDLRERLAPPPTSNSPITRSLFTLVESWRDRGRPMTDAV
jgi:hypothetical protein